MLRTIDYVEMSGRDACGPMRRDHRAAI